MIFTLVLFLNLVQGLLRISSKDLLTFISSSFCAITRSYKRQLGNRFQFDRFEKTREAFDGHLRGHGLSYMRGLLSALSRNWSKGNFNFAFLGRFVLDWGYALRFGRKEKLLVSYRFSLLRFGRDHVDVFLYLLFCPLRSK